MHSFSVKNIICFGFSGLLLGVASLFPETSISALITITAISLFCVFLKKIDSAYLSFFIFGTVFHAVAFYWLPYTITFFGGFPSYLAYLLYALFCLTAALQFIFCAWIYKRLSASGLAQLLLALPLAWMISEFLFPRLFPWHLGHLLISSKTVAGFAEYGGVTPISGLLVWWGICVSEVLIERKDREWKGVLFCVLVSVIVCGFGGYRNISVAKTISSAKEVKVALVQGNLAAKEKGDVRYFDANLETYQRLSRVAEQQGADVIFWPESVLNRWVPEWTDNVAGTELDPDPDRKLPLLFGGLSYRTRPADELEELFRKFPEYNTAAMRSRFVYQRFNSALAIDRAGEIVGRYHKRVLMPFGEYMPFADQFPAIQKLSPQTGDFTKGDLLEPLELELLIDGHSEQLKAGALICYEDLVPQMSRDAVRRGANILVNLTNDAWYGKSAAPRQHHLLALWRAIETRRYLLRVTNTGYTAVVDPFGNSIASLDIFTEDLIVAPVGLIDHQTIYSKIGDLPLWILSVFGLVFCFLRRKVGEPG